MFQKSSLLFFFILFCSLSLKSQHQVIINNADTLNCYHIDHDYEAGTAHCYISHSDSIYTVAHINIVSIKYNHYPAYPDIKQPRFSVNADFGISLANYTQAFGCLENNPILRISMKQGMNLSLNLQYFAMDYFGITAHYSFLRFGDYKDSTKAKEIFHNIGLGIGYCSPNFTKQFFITGQFTVNYSMYSTEGYVDSEHFSETNELWCLLLNPNLNFHITETVIFRFGVTVNVMSKSPNMIEKVFKPKIGNLNIGLGFVKYF